GHVVCLSQPVHEGNRTYRWQFCEATVVARHNIRRLAVTPSYEEAGRWSVGDASVRRWRGVSCTTSRRCTRRRHSLRRLRRGLTWLDAAGRGPRRNAHGAGLVDRPPPPFSAPSLPALHP